MLKNINTTTFLRIYVSIFAALSIVSFFFSIATDTSFFKTLFLLALACVPLSITLMLLLNKLSTSVVNGLYGLGTKEDNTAEICNSEIVKLISFKENEEYEKVLSGLTEIERQYGTSSRIIYERALCLTELGELKKARRYIKDFLSATQPDQHDSYQQYCRQLISNDHAPLSLENINAESKQ